MKPSSRLSTSAAGDRSGPEISPARRFTAWTTNLVATAVVILLGVTVGRNVSYWWTPTVPVLTVREQAERMVGASDVAGDDVAQEIRFGDAPVLFRRRRFHGSADELWKVLQSQTIDLARQAVPPPQRWEPGESRMVASVAGQKPRVEMPGQWAAYLEPLPLPMALVLSSAGEGANSDDARRVLSWGMAFPHGDTTSVESAWTVFSICPRVGSPGGFAALAEVPLPRGVRRDISLSSATGATLISFHGVATIDEWTGHFSDWFSHHGWKTTSPWSELRRGARAQFVDPHGVRLEVDIVWEREQLRGLLSAVPEGESPE